MSYNLNDTKWGTPDLGKPSGEITWSMALIAARYSTGSFPNLTLAQFEVAVRAAFNAWEQVANLDFRQVSGDSAGIVLDIAPLGGNTVGFASWGGIGGDGDGDGISQTTSATIDFKQGHTWDALNQDGPGTNLYAVALHEIGHTLGLGHADDASEVLFGTIFASDLGDGDIAGIQEIYGPRNFGTSSADVINLSDLSSGVTIIAAQGNDRIVATQGDDLVFGGAGNDTLSGSGGADAIIDTLGNNVINGGGGNDLILGGAGTLRAQGGSGNDIIIGGIGDDRLFGNNGNDTLRGDLANSFFFGSDLLVAGRGTDYLEGGSGADTFEFSTGDDTNYIARLDISQSDAGATRVLGADFDSGIDTVDLTDFGYGTRAEVFDHISTSGGHAVFSDQGTTIHFIGLLESDLSTGDFLI